MSRFKRYEGYRSFQYLTAGKDYRAFDLAPEPDRVEPYRVPLTKEEEERAGGLLDRFVLVSLHEHVGLHRTYASNLSIREAHGESRTGGGGSGKEMEFQEVDYVKGLENPAEGSANILRWLVKHGYCDEDIEKVMGGNALRLLREVWS
jgi:hypothetical protein